MPRLSHREYKRLADSLLKLYSFSDEETWHANVTDLLPEAVHGEGTFCVDTIIPHNSSLTIPLKVSTQPRVLFSDKVMEAVVRYNVDDPISQYFLSTRDCSDARLRSDFISRQAWERSPLYNEVYRPTKLAHTASMTLAMKADQNGEHLLTIGIHRENGRKNFTESDRCIITLLRPHLLQSRRTATLIARLRSDVVMRDHAVEQAVGGVVAVTKEGRIRWTTPQALAWITEFVDRPRRDRLPELLERWYRQEEVRRTGGEQLLGPREPLALSRAGKTLLVRHVCFPDTAAPSQAGCLLLLEMRSSGWGTDTLQGLGLTRREAEVLRWVADGKTNAEIGQILGISQRTVQKHLEHVFQILGVETRTAAALRATELLKGGHRN